MQEQTAVERLTEEQLDKIELESYRGIRMAQAQLAQFEQNLVVIAQERKRRAEKRDIKVTTEPE